MGINYNKYGLILLSITRKEIESFDHIRALDVLNKIKNNAKKCEGKLNISVSGYDQDSRELYEIQEIRIYFDFLDRCFPYWFFFFAKKIQKNLSPFITLISLVVPYKFVAQQNKETKLIQFDEDALKNFITTHFYFLNELTDALGMSLDENKRISKEIFENLF